MNTVASIFEQAQLAEAAYADFSNPNISHLAALQAEKFSATQATEFLNNWQIVDHVPDLNSGFSATIFERLSNGNPTGEYSLGIRGSLQIVDFAADAALIANQGVATSQLVDLY